MEVNFKKNSITARLYRWFYGIDTLPQNLCPYFWKTIIMYLFIIPFSPFIFFFNFIDKNLNPFSKVVLSILILFCLYGVFMMIASLVVLFNYVILHIKPNTYWSSILVGGLTIDTGLLVYGISKLISYITLDKPKIKQSNLITSFIKAKYNKYCPQINWN